MNVRILITLAVFAADVWALMRMFAQPMSRGRRVAWIARIVLLPLGGAGLWWLRERRSAVST